MSDRKFTLLLDAFKFRYQFFAVKIVLFLLVLFVFFSSSLINGRSCVRCNVARQYVIQLVIWVFTDFLKLKHLCLIISSFGGQLSQKCR